MKSEGIVSTWRGESQTGLFSVCGFFFFSSRRRHTRYWRDWSSDVCSSDLMDRLICGDVGYGKTEIAVRAAFKAVQDGKQVAVLVPTTLLAQQHYNTFSERMGQFPVEIRQLSRFQTPREAAQTLEMAAGGTADIVIGTHRLLQSATRFKDLGMVVVDEEQRFGVE